MAKDKKALRDMFAMKTEEMPEEEMVEEEVVEEEMPEEEAPAEEADPGEAKMIIDGCKEAYDVFLNESKQDPMMALDNLIEALGALRGSETEMAGDFLPGDEAPLAQMPLNM